MRARPLIPLFILMLAAVTPPLLHAADTQSLHFPVPAPAGATGTDDLRIGLKAAGLTPINSGEINLTPLEVDDFVATRAARALCLAACSSGRATCTGVFPACDGLACCDSLIALPHTGPTLFNCLNATGKGFLFDIGAFDNAIEISKVPADGNIQNLTADNKNIYPDVGVDIASRSLIQLRPNGVTGNIQLRIHHTQGGANPRVATVVVDASNNDPGESQALHDAARIALQGIAPALAPAIVASVHTVNEANYPLTSFSHLKQAGHFLQITNILPVGITEVEVVTVAGQGFTIEGTENQADLLADQAVPTLSEWGAIFAAAILMLMIYWLHRKRMKMQQAA